MPKTHPARRSRHAEASEGPPDDRTMSRHCRADRHAEELLASALAPVEQLEIKDTPLTVTAIHFKHSKGKPLTLTIKGTTSPQDCRLQIMEAYLSVRGATEGTLFLYCLQIMEAYLSVRGATEATLFLYCLQIMEAYLSVRGATEGTLFLYWPSVPVTKSPSLMSSYEEPYSFIISAPNSLNRTAFV